MLDGLKRFINDRYGSRHGLVNHYKFSYQHKRGQFASAVNIDWKKVERLVFICHGNICRSPLAEVAARQRFHLNAESFGIDCTDGSLADPRAVTFAKSVGLDLTQHRARHIKNYQAQHGDLVIGMEPKHLQALAALDLNGAPLTLAGLWLEKPTPYIHDPYSSSPHYFDRCENAVVASIDRISSLIHSRG